MIAKQSELEKFMGLFVYPKLEHCVFIGMLHLVHRNMSVFYYHAKDNISIVHIERNVAQDLMPLLILCLFSCFCYFYQLAKVPVVEQDICCFGQKCLQNKRTERTK